MLRSKLTIRIVAFITCLVMAQSVSASLFNPFGEMKEIKMLDGIIIVAVCTTKSPLTRTSFWEDGQEASRGAWLNVVWEYQGPDATYADRTAWMAISDPNSQPGKKDSYTGGKLVAWEKSAYRIETWIYIDPMTTSNTLSITCGVKGRKGEKDKTDKLIIPISTKSLRFVTEQPIGVVSTPTLPQPASIVMQSGSSSNQTVLASGSVPQANTTYVTPGKDFNLRGDYTLLLANQSQSYKICGLNGTYKSKVIFARSGCKPVCAEIIRVRDGKIYAELETNAGSILPYSDIVFDKEVN